MSLMWKRFIQSSDSGFTLFELLVASFIGLTVFALASESVLSLRRVYSHDIVGTRLIQDLRGSLDMIGVNVRQAGENFTMAFPAVEIVNGSSGAPDELIMRRNLMDEVLNICTDITAGSAVTSIFFATAGTEPGCARTDNLVNYSAWRTYRLAAAGQQVKAYAYNPGLRTGEFFVYASETDSGTELNITRSAGVWANDYTIGSGAVYILEEWHFRLQGDVLQLIIDGDVDNALNVSFGLTDFQVRAHLEDGSVVDALAATDDWTQISALEVSLSAEGAFAGETLSKSLSARYFPRNVLSN